MKKILSGLVLTVVLFISCADNSPIPPAAINFYEGSWQQAVAQAKNQNKKIFLFAHASWCGVCKKVERNTISKQAVGDYFNNNFVNVSIDIEKGEGIELSKKYNIESIPQFFILDTDGNIVKKKVGYADENDLLNFPQ